MKPLSRMLTLFVVFTLCVTTFAACSKTENTTSTSEETSVAYTTLPTDAAGLTDADRAYTLYEKALKLRAEVAGLDASLTGTATVKTADHATEWTMDMDWTSQQPSDDPSEYTDHLTESIVKDNDVIERNLYYGNGTIYVSQNGQKFRQLTDRKLALAETALFTLPSLTKAAFSSPLIVYEKENTVLSLPMNGDILSEELTSPDGALAYLLGGIHDEVVYTFGDINLNLTLDQNGYLTAFSIYYSVTADDEAQTTATVNLSVSYRRVDTDITVKLPNAANYKERIGSGLSKAAYAVMTDVVDILFGADGNRVSDFDVAYEAACKQYKKALVDEIVQWFEAQ